MKAAKIFPLLFLAAVLVLVGIVIAAFFQQIPTEGNSLALDWKRHLWPSLRDGLPYDEVGHLLNPPWTVVLLLPLGQIPVQTAWGILAYITLLVLIASVPRARRRWLYWLSIFLLILSYPSIRNLVDGNLEALIILGVLLLLRGYEREEPLLLALGILFALTKPQTVFLLLLALALYLVLSKKPIFWLRAGLIVLLIAAPFAVWRGPQLVDLMFRIPDQGSVMDISLMATLERITVLPSLFHWIAWGLVLLLTAYAAWVSRPRLTREKAGLFIAGSLLLAPYSGSTLTLVAVGVIPLFQKRRWLGGFLLLLNWGLTAFNQPVYQHVLGNLSAFVLLLSWAALLWATVQEQRQQVEEVPVIAEDNVQSL